MSGGKLPEVLRYTKTHEWIRSEGAELVVGITDHAQEQLTDIVYVDLPAEGKAASAGTPVLVLESVKTVADVYAPVDGQVTAVNGELKTHPERINQDPYGAGWLYRLKPSAPFDPSKLLSAAEYLATLG
jgi:glycine cleavage system H protein